MGKNLRGKIINKLIVARQLGYKRIAYKFKGLLLSLLIVLFFKEE